MLKQAHEMKRLLKLNNTEANKCFDKMLSLTTKKFEIDIINLDDILHERHGNYENENMSMESCIEKYYGQEAKQFVETTL